MVGRTGAGKSSLVMSLFRLVEYERCPPAASIVGEAAAAAGAHGGDAVDEALRARAVDSGEAAPSPASCGIAIDGRWIHDVSLSELRASLGVIPQDPTLFRCAGCRAGPSACRRRRAFGLDRAFVP